MLKIIQFRQFGFGHLISWVEVKKHLWAGLSQKVTFPDRWFILKQALDAALTGCKGDNPILWFCPCSTGTLFKYSQVPTSQTRRYLHLPLHLQQPHSITRHGLLLLGCFEQGEKFKTRKPSGGHVKILPTLLQHSVGPQQNGFFHPFCQEYLHPYKHEERAGCAVSCHSPRALSYTLAAHCHHHSWGTKILCINTNMAE